MEATAEHVHLRVPVFLSGIVLKIEGPDFCMDGATHILQTILGPYRLKTDNPDVLHFLNRVAGTRLRVTIAGYPVWGPECSHINVYYAAPSHETLERLGLKNHGFEWTAWHDSQPVAKPTLHVEGWCAIHPGGSAKLEPAVPQGINPTIYILNLVITNPVPPPGSPSTGALIETPVKYVEQTNVHYSHVQIMPGNIMVKVREVS